MNKQFARTPYAVGFRSGDTTFVLVTLHVLYGENVEARFPEVKAIADWMAAWAEEMTDWEQNLILLGDFNIDRHGSPIWQAFRQYRAHRPIGLGPGPPVDICQSR